MRISKAHIAGVAVAQAEDDALLEPAIAAGTRALLDAGVTYSDIDQNVACFQDGLQIPRECFDVFGMEGAPCHEISNSSGLFTAVQYIQARQADCVLVIGLDTVSTSLSRTEFNQAENGQDASISNKAQVSTLAASDHGPSLVANQGSKATVVGIVLVSDLFLTSHAYLKDSAIRIRGFSLANQIYSRTLGGSDRSRTFQRTASDALRQAQLKSADIQLLHLPQTLRGSNPQALVGFDAAASELSRPLSSHSSTAGLTILCSLGKVPSIHTQASANACPVWQFRGWADGLPLQARNCLLCTSGPHDIASILILERSDGRAALTWEEVRDVRDGRERLGYNPAVETKKICAEDVQAVQAPSHFVPENQTQRHLPAKGGDRAALARL